MEKKKRHPFKTRLRAFTIWQKLGYLPWQMKKENKKRKPSGEFYKGAFNNIPFLNNDAKRTFVQLLFRPGYMIRDYIKGANERYLAPLTALIVFYAFFALVSAVMAPVQNKKWDSPFHVQAVDAPFENEEVMARYNLLVKTLSVADKGLLYLHLDQYPEEVDTQFESSLAALEGALRNQGIPLFLGKFFLLWLAMAWALRRYRMKMSATAAASAYILCQYSFFMLFALLLSFGQSSEVGVLLTMVLLVWDYHQWLGASTKKSIWLAISTGLCAIFLIVVLAFFIGGASFLIARSQV
jgi:hypothetical protein